MPCGAFYYLFRLIRVIIFSPTQHVHPKGKQSASDVEMITNGVALTVNVIIIANSCNGSSFSQTAATRVAITASLIIIANSCNAVCFPRAPLRGLNLFFRPGKKLPSEALIRTEVSERQ